MRGQFILFPNNPKKRLIVPNTLVDTGEESFIKMIARADVTDVASGGNFFVGLLDEAPGETLTLAAIATEPTAAGGYARKAVTRNAAGWPTLQQVAGTWMVRSAVVNFTAVGAAFSRSITRAFLANVLSGVGILFSVSGAFPAQTVLDGETLPIQYELYMQ